MTHEKLCYQISKLLTEAGFSADRVDTTGDGSVLFQFLSRKPWMAVDVYPNGEIVVLIRREDERNEIHELEATDGELVLDILRKAQRPMTHEERASLDEFTMAELRS